MTDRGDTLALPAVAPRARSRWLDAVLSVDGLLVVILLTGCCLFRLRKPIGDPDLGWHLAVGREMLRDGRIPTVDHFSYVAEGRPWLVYSWLAEVFFAACEALAGPGGLIVLSALLVTATSAVVLSACRATGARHAVAIGITALAAVVAAPTWTVRPHLFSFLFTALVTLLVSRDGRAAAAQPTTPLPRAAWLLVPMTALWANTHVFFIYGFAVLGIHAFVRWRGWLWDVARGRPRGEALALGIALAAALLATPHGLALPAHLLALADEPVTFEMVSELQTPSLHALPGKLLAIYFFAVTLVLVLSPLRRDPGELATVYLFAFLAFSMARNMPFFAIVAAPVLTRHLDALLPRTADPPPTLSHRRRRLHALVLGGWLVFIGCALPRTAAYDRDAAVSATRYPRDAVAFLERQPPLGRLFNHFNWGGYLIATLYPRYRVSIDGRTGVYGDANLAQYRATQRLRADWRTYFDRCDPDVVVWRKDEPFVQALALLPEWRRLYEDAVAVIFVREPPRAIVAPPHA